MGRSQVKYRPSRGRGRGDSTRGGRGGRGSADSTGVCGSGKPKRSGGRALGSNAFRYEERDENDPNADGADDASLDTGAAATRRQFFAGEQKYRDMADAKESYFRTKAVQRWEAEDDDDDDNATRVATSTVGVMDFAWIAAQLAAVPPSLRYQIDPKYCGDLAFAQRVDDERPEPEAADSGPAPSGDIENSGAAASTDISPGIINLAPAATSTLDDLLALSASTPAVQTAPAASSAPTLVALSSPAETAASGEHGGQENLEDWLDDVLDM